MLWWQEQGLGVRPGSDPVSSEQPWMVVDDTCLQRDVGSKPGSQCTVAGSDGCSDCSYSWWQEIIAKASSGRTAQYSNQGRSQGTRRPDSTCGLCLFHTVDLTVSGPETPWVENERIRQAIHPHNSQFQMLNVRSRGTPSIQLQPLWSFIKRCCFVEGRPVPALRRTPGVDAA